MAQHEQDKQEQPRDPDTSVRRQNDRRPRFFIWIYVAILAGILFAYVYSWGDAETNRIEYSTFLRYLEAGYVESLVVVDDSRIEGKYTSEAARTGEVKTVTPRPGLMREDPDEAVRRFETVKPADLNLTDQIQAYNARAEAEGLPAVEFSARVDDRWYSGMFWYLIPLALIIALWIFLIRRMNPGQQVMNIGKNKASLYDRQTEIKINFSDVAGLEEPKQEVEEIVALAIANNPALRASRAQYDATSTARRVARSDYLPTLSASLGFRGDLAQAANIAQLVQGELDQMARTRQSCLDQNQIRQSAGLAPNACPDPSDPAVRSQLEDQFRARHSGFPFGWTSQPMSASLTVSLPLFTGLNRQQRLEEANIAVLDARHAVRAEELRVSAESETLRRNGAAAYRPARLQARVRETASEELRLAQEQYRSGLATSVEVTDAQTNLSEAERAEIAAIYDYHQSLAALEALLGATLR
jgi:hypothetical protein